MTKPRKLYEPDFRPVRHAGSVRCVICSQPVALGAADLVGLGYRCADCSLRAQIDGSDEAAHLTAEERSRVLREPAPRTYALAGAALLAIATVMWIARVDVELPFMNGSVFFYVFVFGVGALGLGWFRWLDRRR